MPDAARRFGQTYQRRILDERLDTLFPELGAIMLAGPKAVGKTATASARTTVEWRLDQAAVRAIAEADPDLVTQNAGPTLIDEWQRVPGVWDAVKRAVDRDAGGGRFLLTGSAPPRGVAVHSGAGRIATFRMRPLTLPERGSCTPSVSLAGLASGDQSVAGTTSMQLVDYTREILRSGFPGFQHLSPAALAVQLDGYLDRIVDVEVEDMGLRLRKPATLRAWLRAYAAATATSASWERIRAASSSGSGSTPSRSTTDPYIDALTRLFILDEVEAWIPSNNHLRRVGQAPKHFLADPALAARLLGLTESSLLQGGEGHPVMSRDGTFLGALFEALAALSVRVFAEAIGARVSHLRLHDGAQEIDMIVELGGTRILAIEVKLSSTVEDRDVRHLHWLREQLGSDVVDAVVLNTGPAAYRRSDGIAVVPLALLGP